MKSIEESIVNKYAIDNVGIGTELAKRFTLKDTVIEKTCKCVEDFHGIDLGSEVNMWLERQGMWS